MLVEAFLRGRPAVAMRVGGIRDVVEDGVNGLLVDLATTSSPTRSSASSTDRALAERLGRAARAERRALARDARTSTPTRLAEAASGHARTTGAAMTAQQAKQVVKNALYRTIGETLDRAPARRRTASRTLRVLMYHKVNDIPDNPTTVPVARFDEQLAQLARARLPGRSTSTRCSTTTRSARRCRRRPC